MTANHQTNGSGLHLKLRSAPKTRLDLSALVPHKLADQATSGIENTVLPAGSTSYKVGDVFDVGGAPGDRIVIEGCQPTFDFVGAELTDGTIIIEGDTGAYCGHRMRSGTIEVHGNAAPFLASNLRGGLITVKQNAGDHLGAPIAGERDGIAGGTVLVFGTIGDYAGERMRRGTIVAKSNIGAFAGARMKGGTIWATNGFGEKAGALMRRGTLISPTPVALLPTFVDCGHHDLVAMQLINRHLEATLGDNAPPKINGPVQKFAGDMASLGKGEVLIVS